MSNKIRAALESISLFSGSDFEKMECERLGGLTNIVYRVQYDGKNYLLRLPGAGTEEFIDRSNELQAASIAAEAGVSAKIFHFADDGTMLAEYILGETLSVEGFKNPGSVRRSALALEKIHSCGKSFNTDFDVFEQINEYIELTNKLGATLPKGYDSVKQRAILVRDTLKTQSILNVPSHCDPLAENFIDTGELVYIVDWEYAGNNDPMWDLGDLSVEAEFNHEQDEMLLESYFDGNIPPKERARMVMYKMLCDLVWTLWGAVQHANNNPADDFESYTRTRFSRCKRLLESDEFKQQLAVLQ